MKPMTRKFWGSGDLDIVGLLMLNLEINTGLNSIFYTHYILELDVHPLYKGFHSGNNMISAQRFVHSRLYFTSA